MSRIALLSVAFVLTFGFAGAQELEEAKVREQVLAQKWTRETTAALDAARGLQRTDPAAARETLESSLAAVRATKGLSEGVRQNLIRQLQAGLNQLPARATAPAAKPAATRPAFAEEGPQRPPTFAGGKSTPGPSSVAQSIIDQNKLQTSKSAEIGQQRNKGINSVVNGVQEGVIPGDRGVVVSPNHKDLMAKRQPKGDAKEEAVMTGLGTLVQTNFEGKTFRQVLEYLTEKTGLMLIPDAASLKEASVEYDDPVNFKLNTKLTARNVLKKMLADRGLAYTIADGAVHIVTFQKARDAVVSRVYNVSDMVSPIRPQPPQLVYNPLTGTFVPGPTHNQLVGQTIVDTIKASVDPQYWQPNGPGSVTFNEATGTIIVRASAEMHYMLGNALSRR